MALNAADIATVSMVCKSFNRLCRDPSLWNKLDLTTLSSYRFKVPHDRLGVWKDQLSSKKLNQLLSSVLDLSKGNTTYLIFNYYVYLSDLQLIYVAERTPNLKRLVLPSSGDLTKVGIVKAMKWWQDLESVTITSVVSHPYIFYAVQEYGKKITELKFTCGFQEYHAEALIKHTPNLRTLSVRSVIVSMKGLCLVLKTMKHLEVVNICHSLIMDRKSPTSRVVVYRIPDLKDHLNKKCLAKLIYCQGNWCLRCKNARDTNPNREPYGHFEDIWREDEIPSLSH
ncbi:hypothetical protein VNO77_20862 [Canavalia gladiata]